jgi:MoxR-vWA-beta-propeller ternary system domain bpX5
VNARGSVSWKWCADPSPPEPHGAVGWHQAARSLHARLAQLPSSVQARLLASANRDVLIVTGAPTDLPWVPGVAYATRCVEAPTLWRPTLLQPDVPADLLARSLQRLHAREPLLLWPEPAVVVPLDRQLRVTPELLQRIAERWQAP